MALKTGMIALVCGVAMGGAAMAVSAQAAEPSVAGIDLRVGKLEKEMNAVQRTVFPQGMPVQPDIGATTSSATGSPASAPLTDLTARVDALEKGLASMTGAVEQANYRNRQQDDTIARLEARLVTLEGGGGTHAVPDASHLASDPKPTALPSTGPIKGSTAKPVVTPTVKADPGRKALVAAVEMPATGDAADDAYTYGYRLYAAKLYPEAEVKLKEFVAKYPAHKRASYAQNLLGRAYYDEGKPALASVAFYDNYQKMPKGDRASESLYWLGQSLTKLKKLPDACKVYDELNDVYGTKMSADLKAKTAKGRADAKCTT